MKNKLIYATPFRASDKQCTGPSTDSGFDSIDAVVKAMGEPILRPTPRTVIYGDDTNRVIFSDHIVFHIDGVDQL